MTKFSRRDFLKLSGAAAVTLALGGCDDEEITLPEYPYDFSGLSIDGDRATFSKDGNVVSELGIDVSYLQGNIDWAAVAADGIDFAFIRIGYRGNTEGGLYVDDYFAENLSGAKAAGIKVGAYFFSSAISLAEATEEAQFCLEQLDGASLDLPLAFDHEPTANGTGRADNVAKEEMDAIVQGFNAQISNAGYKTMIYGNAGDLNRYDDSILAKNAIWFAEYDASHPSSYLNYSVWQYTNDGAVAGISTNVDMNLWFIA